ncbi:MAG: sarcosine oxidase subunit gamma family protein [Steroidobacteraceae bacterium]
MAESSRYLRPLPEQARWILQGGPEALAAAARGWAPGIPREACRALSSGEQHTLWLGPEEFLLLAPVGSGIDGLRTVLEGTPHSLVDVGHRQVAVEVCGNDVETLLAGACPLDLDLAHFPVSMCTRTVFGKADIVLWRTQPQAFHLEVWRSFLPYCTELLAEFVRD